MAKLSSIWGDPHIIDHSTGLLVSGFSGTGAGQYISIIFDSMEFSMRKNNSRLHQEWMFTINIPIKINDLNPKIHFINHLRSFIVKNKDCSVKITFDVAGQKTQFEIGYGTDYNDHKLIDFQLDLTSTISDYNCTLWVSIRRNSIEDEVLIQIDSLDIGAQV
ncbi:hypothetical protein I5M27_08430 [Adhaeribacter sp. BT258]|uniref:Immunity protein 50 n=1 Tax=Adhaeribacter terrigena TaxID=2793070 RepID=A0ABS1C1G7_9BACT|nr:hypothetical protein [Adhaeribacter terrigena]MBK0403011.1 hypothetical protein [Adhaeribacter terrigena]